MGLTYLCKIANLTNLFQQTFKCDVIQKILKCRQGKKLVFTKMLKVLVICHQTGDSISSAECALIELGSFYLKKYLKQVTYPSKKTLK